MTSKYTRSELYGFFGMSEQEQEKLYQELSYMDREDIQLSTFVKDPRNPGEFLPLDKFVRTNNNPWTGGTKENKFTHGIYSLSYHSCYTITFNRTHEEATVAYKYF